MACLRESPPEGRGGVVHCDEEGCEQRCLSLRNGTFFNAIAPSSDCLLQFRLRAGHLEDPSVIAGWVDEVQDIEPTLLEAARVSGLPDESVERSDPFDLDESVRTIIGEHVSRLKDAADQDAVEHFLGIHFTDWQWDRLKWIIRSINKE